MSRVIRGPVDEFDRSARMPSVRDVAWTAPGHVRVEAKTADSVSEFLPRYRRLANRLKLPRSRAVLLWSEADQQGSAASTVELLSGMTLCSLEDFPSHVASLLG